MKRMKDDDGLWVKAGDVITFSFGIPVIGVEAKVIEREGKLIALTPDHTPKEIGLKELKRTVSNFYRKPK